MRVDLSQQYTKRQSKGVPLDFNAARERLKQQQLQKQQQDAQSQTSSQFPTEAPPSVTQSFNDKLSSLVNGVSSFTGGNKIAQGLGQAMAMADSTTGEMGTSSTLNYIQKGQGEMQKKLIDAIRHNQSIGKDTSRLETALKNLTGDIASTGAGANDLLNPNKLTNKQVVGDALQLGTTVVGAGSLPSVGKSIASKTGIVSGALQGAKTGAIGGAGFGALTGVSQGLKQDKNAGDIVKQGIGGAVGGAVTGGVIGGIAGGVSGGLASRAEKKLADQTNFATDLVSPKATDKVKIQALQEGRVTEQGLLKASKILPSKRDMQLADAVKDVVSKKASPAENLNAIASKVQDINSGVKAYVKVNKVPFNTNQLKSQLNQGKSDLNLVFASDSQAEKTYDAVVKEFLRHVDKKDTAGLLDARQTFDKIPAIKKLLDSQGLGENTKKEVVLTVRDMANKYVAKLLPEGNQYRDTLLKESKMIEAIQNIAEKNSNTIGSNKLEVLAKKYPVLKTAIGGVVATYLGLKAIGVGGSIVSSSD